LPPNQSSTAVVAKIKSFFEPLQADKKYAAFFISIILILVVKIYEGDASFYVAQFGDSYTDQDMLQWHMWLYHHVASLVVFCLIPILIITVGFKENILNYGLGIGDWKYGLGALLVAFIVLPFLVFRSSLNPEHASYYINNFPLIKITSSPAFFGLWALTYLPHYIGWEFFFRGYIGFGFKKYHGAFMAIMFQTLLTAMMHIGKPEAETWAAVFGGIYLGLLTYRANSIWYAVIFHWYLGLLNTYLCSLQV